MSDNRYIVVMGWMMTALGLNGNDLLAYALIYGYSQDGQGAYFGSLAHTAEALNISRRTASDVLNRLVERGVVVRKHVELNGLMRCMYKAVVPDEARPAAPEPPTRLKPERQPRSRFEKPTRQEVVDYCAQRGSRIDAQRFYDFYEANGWVQGRGRPLKDWRAAVRTWERTELQNTYNYGQRQNDKDAIHERRQRDLAAAVARLDADYIRRRRAQEDDTGAVPQSS